MKIRIGLKSGKVFEMNNSSRTPSEIFEWIYASDLTYLHQGNKPLCIRCSEIEYIEEIKERKEMNFNQQVEAREFQSSLKEFQEYLRKLETFKYKDFI